MFNVIDYYLNNTGYCYWPTKRMKNTYSIKDLENLTGIKAHTLRIWEKRYQILSPKRSSSNIRYYDVDDLRKILNINLLYGQGHKISKIALLNEHQIITEVQEVLTIQQSTQDQKYKTLLQSIIEMDIEAIENSLSILYDEMGMIDLYLNVIRPLLIRIGELWQLKTINIGHEHLFSNALRSFILSKTSALVSIKQLNKSVLILLLKNEQHELPILFYHYILKDIGWDCIYLGQDVPIHDLELVYHQTKPDMVLTSMISHTNIKQFQNRLDELLAIVPNHQLCLSGANVITHQSEIPNKVNVIYELSDIKKIFNEK